MTDTTVERHTFSDALAVLGGGLVAFVGATIAIKTSDSAMAFHGVLLALAGAAAAFYVITRSMGGSGVQLTDSNGYMDGPIRVAILASVIWGIAGFLVGDIIAWQLAYPALNLDMPWTTFGRLRPLHTSAVIFAFGGNVLIATSFYVVQRTSQARLAGRWSPYFVIWGYNLFIAIAGTGYLLGITQSKEYAEPEW